ncbi:MAG: discoidin domain-containing protein [Gemmataceae bacterium]
MTPSARLLPLLFAVVGCGAHAPAPMPTPPSAAGPAPKPADPAPPPTLRELTPNTNAVLNRFRGRVVVTASSEWTGRPASRVADGDPATSWFSLGSQPDVGRGHWVEVTFPEDVRVTRVTVLGNRDPADPTGYTVRGGRIELLDFDGAVLATARPPSAGRAADFDLLLTKPVEKVRAVRFTATEDDQRLTGAASVAVGEIVVE